MSTLDIHPYAMLAMRLEEWATWARSPQYEAGLWYASESTLYRVMRGIPRTTGRPQNGGHPRAEEIEAAIAQLAHVAPQWAAAVRLKWADRRDRHAKRRQLGVSLRQFYVLAERGEAWLLGRLDNNSVRTTDYQSV